MKCSECGFEHKSILDEPKKIEVDGKEEVIYPSHYEPSFFEHIQKHPPIWLWQCGGCGHWGPYFDSWRIDAELQEYMEEVREQGLTDAAMIRFFEGIKTLLDRYIQSLKEE